MTEYVIVVVGGGAAGGAAARTLATLAAEQDRHVEVVVVGQEERRPYNRTTVNKGLLTAAVSQADIAVAELDHEDLTWRLGTRAVSLDAATRTVTLDDGTSLVADAVVVATGAAPRPLPVTLGPQVLDRVVHLRTPSGTDRLRVLAGGGGRVVVAGAGLIGSEMPGGLAGLTSSVSLLDTAPYPLHRHVGPLVGRWIAQTHAQDGVEVRMGRTIRAVEAAGSRQGGELVVELDDGDVLPAAAVVACLGVLPDTAWLVGSGIDLHLPTGGGVAVDGWQRALGAPGVYAAGDVAAVPGPGGQPVRIEHWGAAIDQGRRAAHAVAVDLGLLPDGDHDAEQPLPGYSTYVGPTKLTVLGWNPPGCVEHVVLGAPGEPRFLVVHVLADRVVGAVGVGGARAANRIRPLIEVGATLAQVQEAIAAMSSSRTS